MHTCKLRMRNLRNEAVGCARRRLWVAWSMNHQPSASTANSLAPQIMHTVFAGAPPWPAQSQYASSASVCSAGNHVPRMLPVRRCSTTMACAVAVCAVSPCKHHSRSMPYLPISAWKPPG
eukprot:scaffold34894_cov21-Tisochrysis_lutea.AAC.1